MAGDHAGARGLAQAFAIGVRPCDPDRSWLAFDADAYRGHLAQKTELLAQRFDAVFGDTGGTDASQREAFERLRDHGHGCRLCDDEPVLVSAARAVPDDLVIMRKQADGWTLAAACLCFPSYWRLDEKIGRPLHDVHETVPGYANGTRNAMLLERMFDRLHPGMVVERANWSVHGEGTLFAPVAKRDLPEKHAISDLAAIFLRREYQTLVKLPGTGDILFSIRVNTDPMEGLAAEPGVAIRLAGQLRALDDAQLAYKGMTGLNHALADALEANGR